MLVSLLVVLTIGNLFIVLDVSQSDVYVSAICLSISGDLFKCLHGDNNRGRFGNYETVCILRSLGLRRTGRRFALQ